MQFNNHAEHDSQFERYTTTMAGNVFPIAGEGEYQYLPSPATTLIAVTTYGDNRDHFIDSATLSDDKIRLLLNARSNDMDAFTSVVLHFDTETYVVNDRAEALSWLGILPRPNREPARIVDADQNEYVDESDRMVMS